jgi:hypothetical protein
MSQRLTINQFIVAGIPRGERRVTRAKQRVIVFVGPDDTGGKVRFYFEDEGPQPFHQQMSGKKWLSYDPAPDPS